MKKRRPYDEAFEVAKRIVDWLEPACDTIYIAGSLRRRCHMIGDIELVAIPTDVRNLFGDTTGETLLDMHVSGTKFQKNGPRYKQFMDGDYQVDLFLASPDTFGYILMLRTGCAEFSHRMVTPVSMGGLRPPDITVQGGQVFQHGIQVAVPDEDTLFALWQMETPTPQERDFA
jgi:DNA polymerase/3'-5' exonuclease PolX